MAALAGMRFGGCPINRAAAIAVRKDPVAIKRIQDGPDARFVLVSAKKVLVTPEKPIRLVWHSFDQLSRVDPAQAALSVYLGPMLSAEGVHQEIFAAQLSASACTSTEAAWVTGRELMLSDASDSDVAVAGLALAITGWHETALYEGRSGSRTVPVEGGMKRQAEDGKSKVYPRTDPVAIGLIVSPDGTRCLLGRSRTYPPGMYTCLSGFVDQCESVEEAFQREAMEEAGVKLAEVSLFASQPWPIGRAGSCELMIGCRAVASSDEIKVNHAEIEDARWFSKAEVKEMLARSTSSKPYSADGGHLFVPPPFAIAHHLIQSFVVSQPSVDSTNVFRTRGAAAVMVGLVAGLLLSRLRSGHGRISLL